jgi:hypothetical protein
MNRRATLIAVLGTIVLTLPACGQPAESRPTRIAATATTAPLRIRSTLTPVVTLYAPTAAPTPTAMAQWQSTSTGVEFLQRRERVGEGVGGADDWVTLVRVDLSATSLRVHYAPETPRTVRDWFGAISPDVVINAGFFTPENKTAGLVVSDGKRYGQTYKGFGGMFSIRNGKPYLQWLAQQPYVQDAGITQAVQSFPMLLLNGQVIDGLPDDGSHNRRSFLGIDRAGRVVLGVCHSPVWTMTDLAHYLATNSLLNLSSAVNLDGGSSTGLWLQGVPDAFLLDSLELVPAVIAINSH